MGIYDELLIKGFEISEEERRRIAKGERTLKFKDNNRLLSQPIS